MRNYLSLPGYRPAGEINLSGLNNALEGYGQQRNLDAQIARQTEEQRYQRGRDSLQDQRVAKADARGDVKFYGDQAAAIDRLQGPQRTAAWQRLIASHPSRDSLTPEYLDPARGPALVMAEAGQYRDPIDDEIKRAQLSNLRQRQSPQAPAIHEIYDQETGQPVKVIWNGASFVPIGGQKRLSPKEQAAEDANDPNVTAGKIAAGLDRLAAVPNDFSNYTFESAVGPLQGDQNSYFGPVARAFGSIANTFSARSPTEVRNRIAGDTEAIAAAIKPLIRKPGEGTWTDADQARLVAVVGNLAQSRNADEYRRNLEGVRQRVQANFGIAVPEINLKATTPEPGDSGPQPGAIEDGYRFRGGDPADPSSWERI